IVSLLRGWGGLAASYALQMLFSSYHRVVTGQDLFSLLSVRTVRLTCQSTIHVGLTLGTHQILSASG
ncbi:MAG: hypothetical protein ABW120_14005, partial [Sedimenticola sp.]